MDDAKRALAGDVADIVQLAGKRLRSCIDGPQEPRALTTERLLLDFQLFATCEVVYRMMTDDARRELANRAIYPGEITVTFHR